MSPEERAQLVAALIAVEPHGLGGVWLRSPAQPLRDEWLKMMRVLMPAGTPWRRMPLGISDRQLFGGLDLGATLKAGAPVSESGLLAAVDGGMLVVAMAERLSARTASCLNAAMDRRGLSVPREGIWLEQATRFGVVALDEGIGDEERLPESLGDRLAFLLDFNDLNPRTRFEPIFDAQQVRLAAGCLPRIRVRAAAVKSVCAAAQALGVESCRSSLLALLAARTLAALGGSRQVLEQHLLMAVDLVLAHRATRLPAAQHEEARRESADLPDAEDTAGSDAAAGVEAPPDTGSAEDRQGGTLDERVIAASAAAIPVGLLRTLQSTPMKTGLRSQTGRSGSAQYSLRRGRPAGVRAGNPRHDGRLNVIATLQAAAPWQRLRAQGGGKRAIRVQASDLRVTRYRQRTRSLIIFAVDASGSAALHRLAEAKGAVELILADCYVRRDQVAVIGFRGQQADVLLPPTRSLVRAKNSLAGLPGGGATPIACGLQAALAMAVLAQRRGDSPSLVLLTDGRANVGLARDMGREPGHRDALRVAAAVRAARVPALFIDTSPRPNPMAREIADALAAHYLPLPSSDSKRILKAVKAQSLGG